MKRLLTFGSLVLLLIACSNEPNEQLESKIYHDLFSFDVPRQPHYVIIPDDFRNVENQRQEFLNMNPLVAKIRNLISESTQPIKCSTLSWSPDKTGILLLKSFVSENQAEQFKRKLQRALPEINEIEIISQNNYRKMVLESTVEHYIKEKNANRY